MLAVMANDAVVARLADIALKAKLAVGVYEAVIPKLAVGVYDAEMLRLAVGTYEAVIA